MRYLLDTNAFSDLMRKRLKVEARLTSLDPTDGVGICAVVRGEILYGIRRLPDGQRRNELLKQASPLFGMLPCEPISATTTTIAILSRVDRSRRYRTRT